jgi:hypothetical protein
VPTNIARWNGTSWSALGTGLSGGTTGTRVMSLTTLLKRGSRGLWRLHRSWRSERHFIARWDGTSWSPLGTGLTGSYYGGHIPDVPDDAAERGSRGRGDFTAAGGVSAYFVARWNGTSWSSLPASESSMTP